MGLIVDHSCMNKYFRFLVKSIVNVARAKQEEKISVPVCTNLAAYPQILQF